MTVPIMMLTPRKLPKLANPILLEPIMKIEVSTPEDFMGEIIGDLSSKRAKVQGTTNRGKVTIITAEVPLAEMTQYVTILRSMTQGRASFYMEPSHYEEVPANIADKIIAKSKPSAKPAEDEKKSNKR